MDKPPRFFALNGFTFCQNKIKQKQKPLVQLSKYFFSCYIMFTSHISGSSEKVYIKELRIQVVC